MAILSVYGKWTQLPDVLAVNSANTLPFSIRLNSGCLGIDILIDSQNHRFALCYNGCPSRETLTHVLADLVIPRLLAHDGRFVLHCGIASSTKGAFGFMGPSGHGKSTMTASLHHRGMPLMSDDAVIVEGQGDNYRAERLYASLRLFPDSLDHLFSATESTAPVADNTNKRHVAFLPGPDSAPLIALFRLADPAEEIRATRLAPAEACMALIENSFALDSKNLAETKQRFAKSAEVARSLPIYDLYFPREYEAIPRVHTLLFETLGLKIE